METFQQEFLGEAITQLEKLTQELNALPEDKEADILLREIFRRVHTIKGSSQVFGLKIPANLAHNLENLLDDLRSGRTGLNSGVKPFLAEGLQTLLGILADHKDGKGTSIPHEYLSRLHGILDTSHKAETQQITGLPIAGLTEQEKARLEAAIGIGHKLFLIEAFFSSDNLEGFKTLRDSIASSGEVIAISPAAYTPPEKLGFRIHFVSDAGVTKLEEVLSGFQAHFVYPGAGIDTNHSHDINGALAQIVSSAEKAANLVSKRVRFEIAHPLPQLESPTLQYVCEILLHLVRNAVDHAIEIPDEREAAGKKPHGTIKINISDADEKSLLLALEDDGQGIDLDKVRNRAVDESGSGKNESINRETLLDLIFTHGFTTRDSVSDYSGRGIGLDIVKQIVDREGGSIEVSTEPGNGTSFVIRLPKDPSS